MLSVWVGLLLLLLPFLLLTTSPDKLTAIDLHLSGQGGAPAPARLVETVQVTVRQGAYELRTEVRKTDVNAAAGDVEARVVSVPDLPALQAELARVKALDPGQTRIRVVPDDAMPTSGLVRVLDAVRAHDKGELYPDVELAEGP